MILSATNTKSVQHILYIVKEKNPAHLIIITHRSANFGTYIFNLLNYIYFSFVTLVLSDNY